MKKIGFIIAVEWDPFIEVFGEAKELIDTSYGVVSIYEMDEAIIYVIKSGVGQIAAAACTQLLISMFKVDYIFNCGVVGGLTEEMKKEKICLVEKVVHYDFDTSKIDNCEPARYLELDDIWIPTDKELIKEALEVDDSIKVVKCASGDKFIDGRKEKEELFNKYGTDICEMEAAAIALTSYRNNIPCLLLKIISDAIEDNADVYFGYHTLAVNCFKIMKDIIIHLIKNKSC